MGRNNQICRMSIACDVKHIKTTLNIFGTVICSSRLQDGFKVADFGCTRSCATLQCNCEIIAKGITSLFNDWLGLSSSLSIMSLSSCLLD